MPTPVNSYLELDHTQLIAFANGSSVNGITLATPGSGIIDSGPALTIITNAANAWTLAAKVMFGFKEIYTLHHA
jgi:hypothetical protein